MHKKKVELLFIALSSPVLIGVYENSRLIESVASHEKSSDILPDVYKELSDKYDICGLFYTNGPGSFMAIKVTYIFLKSVSILKNIPLFARDAFYFNENRPIKAIGKLFFVKVASQIKTQKLSDSQESRFELPDILDYREFNTTTLPIYGIGAVG